MNFWTEQREEQLRNLWADGHSTRAIAKMIGDTTHNAVTGKLHRLGFDAENRKIPVQRQTNKCRIRALTKPSRIVSNNNGFVPRADSKPPLPVKTTDVEQTNAFPIIYGRAQAVLSRAAEQCGFPMGEGEQFHYCTNAKGHGKHYCDGHHAVCWTAPKRRDAA